MSISSLQNSLYTYVPGTPFSGAGTTQATGQIPGTALTDPDGDGDKGMRQHGHGGGGRMGQALMQALQALGLDPASTAASAGTSSTTSSGGASGSSDADGDADGSASGVNATGSVGNDMHQFMHALFQALSGESGTASGDANAGNSSSGGSSGNNSSSSGFAADLSALVTQVSNGSAPSALQTAFNHLVSDLQAASGSSTSLTVSGTAPTLAALLTQLQQNLGYGSAAGTGTSNLVSVQA